MLRMRTPTAAADYRPPDVATLENSAGVEVEPIRFYLVLRDPGARRFSNRILCARG